MFLTSFDEVFIDTLKVNASSQRKNIFKNAHKFIIGEERQIMYQRVTRVMNWRVCARRDLKAGPLQRSIFVSLGTFRGIAFGVLGSIYGWANMVFQSKKKITFRLQEMLLALFTMWVWLLWWLLERSQDERSWPLVASNWSIRNI